MSWAALADAADALTFGAKAANLARALLAGLPVPPGVALAAEFVERVASSNAEARAELESLALPAAAGLAVRSSAVDEDTAGASFAGLHRTFLNVSPGPQLPDIVRRVWLSASGDAAIAYRRRLGIEGGPAMAVILQQFVPAELAGVLFTVDPVNGVDECVVEAAWGLGEAVVAGRVVPDRFRIGPSGVIVEQTPGVKRIALRLRPGGGTGEDAVAADLVERLCLGVDELRALADLASRCEALFGAPQDIEWAFAGGELHLLQVRPITA